jgi:hypothetical protein
MAQSLWSQPDNQSAVEVPKVSGCRGCGLIYEPRVYFLGASSEGPSRCPKCTSPQVEDLGSLPFTTTTERGVYLIGELDEGPLGPFKTDVEAHSKLWSWFDLRKESADREKQKGQPASQGKVIQLITKNRPAKGW